MAVALGESATCTINNDDQPAQLTLVKTVTNDNGGTAVPTAWTLTRGRSDADLRGDRERGGDRAPVSAGTYTLSESGGPAGYTAAAWTCVGRDPDGCVGRRWRSAQSATCTINNDDQPAQLTLVKTVTNDNGGTAVATDWTLTRPGPTPIVGCRPGSRR